MSKYNRQIDAKFATDPHSAEVVGFNQPAGGKKTLDVGPVRLPIPTGTGYTITPTATTMLPAVGKNIAVYNSAATVGFVTLGKDLTLVAGTPGAVNAAGQAPIPCPPGQWTAISMGLQQAVIAYASTLYVYLVEDGTFLFPESK